MLKKKLEAYNIQYYLVHGELRNKLDILKPDKKFGDITIYKIVTPKKGSNAGIEVKGWPAIVDLFKKSYSLLAFFFKNLIKLVNYTSSK